MGIAATPSAQSKCVDMGDDACCSISSLHDGGAISCGCRASTRDVGAIGCPSGTIGTGGMHVIDGGDAVGMGGHAVVCIAGERGGQPSGVCSWGVEVGWVCGGSFPPCVCQWLG